MGYFQWPMLICLLTMSAAWAQKSAILDNQKALKIQIECQRIADLKLLKSDAPLKINCQLDNMHFYSDVPLTDNQAPLKIGNFNLLHPGTDKTLFKDMGLVAELINQEFDIMAGVELVDVVATPKENNLKLLPLIENKSKTLKLVIEQIKDQRLQIDELSKTSEPVGPSPKELALKKQLEQKKVSLKQLEESLSTKKSELEQASADIVENSTPGFSIFGMELGKKKRLERLELARNAEITLTNEVSTLEKQRGISLTQISDLQNQILNLPPSGGISETNRLLIEKINQKLSSLIIEEKNLSKILNDFTRYYRIPGYLKILEELRKLDSSWSLIMSPHGDAAVESNAQEHTGFYYRASKIGLSRNVHCSNQFNKTSSGCYPNFYAEYMGENTATIFSRRPFLATFTDGHKPFSIIAAHVVFEAETDPAMQQDILEKTFKVSSLNQLPTGINKQNYARFAETVMTLKLIEKLRDEGLERIIYAGDFNLEAQNPFWKYINQQLPGSVVLVEGKTSLSENRFVKGKESEGVSSNYDHFILSASDASACRNAAVVNFLENDFSQKIKDKYLVRVDAAKGPYQQDSNAGALIESRTQTIRTMLETYNFLISKTQEISLDTKLITEDLKNFQLRVFDSQLSDETYYKYFSQIMSDHLPIKMECQF